MITMSFDTKEIDKMLQGMEKNVGQSGHTIITFWGMGNYKRGSTLTGQIALYHVKGLGNNKVRNPLGFDAQDRTFLAEQSKRYVDGKADLNKTLNNIGEKMARKVVFRMTKGQNADGVVFEEYSEGYKRVRRKRKKRINPPDLQFDGIMKESLRHEVFINR
jgi:hypothetical protein